MSPAGQATDRGAVAAPTAAVGLPLLALVSLVVADRRLAQLGRDDLRDASNLIYLVAIVSAAAVGTVLLLRRPGNPAGWCFAGLGISMSFSGILDGYAAVGAVADPGSLPGANVAAVLGDASFIPWLLLVSLALHLTPTGRPVSAAWGRVAAGTVLAGATWWAAKLLSDTTLDRPFDAVHNPMAVPQWAGAVEAVRAGAGALTGMGLLAAGLSLLVRFGRSRGLERQQLHWLALAVIPLPLFVGLSFYGAYTERPLLVIVSTMGYVAVIPIAAGLAIGQYHLYDVDQVLSRTTTYVLLSGGVLTVYLVGVVVIDRTLGGLSADHRSSASAAVAALAVAGAAPMRSRLQNAVDRRFSRRRFSALAVVRSHAQEPEAGATVDTVLRQALGDPSVTVAYWIADRGQWVTADGGPPADVDQTHVELTRLGQPVARVGFDPGRCDRELVRAVSTEALPALETTGLRAALALELLEVHASRARIVQAQLGERQRIERDLHDGAQQRLLAMAMELQAALVNGEATRLRQAAQAGVDQAKATVRELRALANGLHPAALTDGGLAAAVEDLAGRVPGPVDLHVDETRYPRAVEVTAWFIVCEAVANAMKHAAGARVRVEVRPVGGRVLVRVSDDGPGIADPEGGGLRGLADRAAAVGGWLTVRSSDRGTVVEAEVPCAS
ncbi:MAG: sensor histidine kinase [Geodermatophilaceae bacterium]